MPNLINFDTCEQYRSIFGTVQIDVLKKIYYFIHSSLFFITFLCSLSYFFSIFFLRLLLAPVTPSSLFLLLSSLASSWWLRVFFFLCAVLSLSLSFPVMKKKAILIWSRARRLKLANLNLCLPRGSRQYLLIVLHSHRSLPVVLHNSCCQSRHRWLVEFGHWLICWVGVLLKILSFILFLFFYILLRFLDLEFVGGSGDCGCSLWQWLLVFGWWRVPLGCVFVYSMSFE